MAHSNLLYHKVYRSHKNIRKDCIIFQNNVRIWKKFKLGKKYWEETTLRFETTHVYDVSYLIQRVSKENCHSKNSETVRILICYNGETNPVEWNEVVFHNELYDLIFILFWCSVWCLSESSHVCGKAVRLAWKRSQRVRTNTLNRVNRVLETFKCPTATLA